MWDFWTARPPLNALLSVLPLLRPRRYSIASSPGRLGDHGTTVMLRWAGSGCYTAAWSLLSKPFWFQDLTKSRRSRLSRLSRSLLGATVREEKPSSCLARMVAEIWAGRAATSADLETRTLD